MGEALDFEAIRHRVKLLRDTGDERVFENRDDVACPVCGESFTEALATSERTCQLSPGAPVDLCLVRESKRTDRVHARVADAIIRIGNRGGNLL